jgi:DNA-binding response OmpR family regulator
VDEISRVTGARILVVEDDPSAARFAEYVLSVCHGCDVTCAADPETALALLAGQSWDLVVTNVDLPHMSGLGLLESAREFLPDMPFVVMSASLTTERFAAARRPGADILLEKPATPQRLADAVASLLGRAVARSPAAGSPACRHSPRCPAATAPDRDAARTVAAHPEQGWSLLCNGIVLFDDTGELLPDGSVIAPRRAPPARRGGVPAVDARRRHPEQ